MSSNSKIKYVRDYDLCDHDHFYIIKGISIIAALVSYVCTVYFRMQGLQAVQSVAAAVFVFCSGYGLSESYIRKGGLVHYWENKMIKVWLPSLVTLIAVWFVFYKDAIGWIDGNPLGLKGKMLYLIFGGYAVFWGVFYFVQKPAAQIFGIFVISTAIILLLPEGLSVKEAVLAFPIGVMASQLKWRRPIRKMTWKGRTLLFFAVAAVGAGSCFLAVRLTVPGLQALLWAISYTAIGILLILVTYFTQKVPVFGIFVPFGRASYALYLLYSEIFLLLRGQTDWRAYVIVGLVLCAAAAIVTVLRELLIAWNYKLRRRKKPRLKGIMW